MLLTLSSSTIDWNTVKPITEIILSAVAIFISVFAIVKTSRDNNKILEETSRAYISVYTETLIANKNHFYIIFRNFGKSNAFIKNISIDDKTREMIKIGDKDFINNITKSNIAPGQSITHVVATENKKYNKEHISEFTITYLSGRKEYTDNFKFCLGANTRMPSIGLSSEELNIQFLELYQDQIRKSL